MTRRIDALRAPLLVSWQLTRDCDLCCLHCCTESAPGKSLPHELDGAEAMHVASEIVRNDVPYVMLCGGEPLVAPHFFAIAEALGNDGVALKIETNGQRLDRATVRWLARLPVRSIQVSVDADTEEVYRRVRPGASLAKAHAACEAVRDAGLPLEISFAPTRHNIAELPAVIERARSLGAFRFNSGKLMRIGTAAKLWPTLVPSADQYRDFRATLDREARVEDGMQLCYIPFDIEEGLRRTLDDPPATLLVLPDGRVKVAAALPFLCADLREHSLADAWSAYRDAWKSPQVIDAALQAIGDPEQHAGANRWQSLSRATLNDVATL